MKEGKKKRRLLLTFRANKGGEGKRRGRAHKQREGGRESSSHLVCGPLFLPHSYEGGEEGISLPSLPDLGAAGGGRQRVHGAKEKGKKGRGVKWWRRDPSMWPPLYLVKARAAEKREGEEEEEEGAPTRERETVERKKKRREKKIRNTKGNGEVGLGG